MWQHIRNEVVRLGHQSQRAASTMATRAIDTLRNNQRCRVTALRLYRFYFKKADEQRTQLWLRHLCANLPERSQVDPSLRHL